MQEKTNATLCFACTSSNNYCEINQNTERTYHVKKKKLTMKKLMIDQKMSKEAHSINKKINDTKHRPSP